MKWIVASLPALQLKLLLLLLSPLLLLQLLLVQPSNGCGMVTHNVVAARASQYMLPTTGGSALRRALRDAIRSHADAVQGGAPFPDYFYQCGDPDAAEAAHWVPYQVAAVQYVRQAIAAEGGVLSDATQRLVAFLAGGLVSHYFADINWHGLDGVPYGQGFIRTLGGVNYNCHGDLCSDAHTAADTGGEFMAAHQTDLSFFHPTQWYVPANDTAAIWASMGFNITADAITQCMQTFTLGAWAIQSFGDIIFQLFADPNPFMVDHYLDFHVGGVDDMAIGTAWMTDRFLDWLETGPPPAPYPPSLRSGSRPPASPREPDAAVLRELRSAAEHMQ
jgi:glycosylphosphatidylinositol phospholipase D